MRTAYTKGYRALEDGSVVGLKGHKLSLWVCPSGYKSFNVNLGNNVNVLVCVHRLVAYQKFGDAAFAPKAHTRHLDGDPGNNTWDNIDMGTASQNMMDIPKEARIQHAQKGGNAVRRFTAEEVVQIRLEHAAGDSYNKLAEKWGVGKSTLSFILSKSAKKKALY